MGIHSFCAHRLSVLGSLFQAGPREHSESVGREEKKYLLPAWSLSMVPSSLLFQATTVCNLQFQSFVLLGFC